MDRREELTDADGEEGGHPTGRAAVQGRNLARDLEPEWASDLEPKWLEPKWLEPKWLDPKWLRKKARKTNGQWMAETESPVRTVIKAFVILTMTRSMICAHGCVVLSRPSGYSRLVAETYTHGMVTPAGACRRCYQKKWRLPMATFDV